MSGGTGAARVRALISLHRHDEAAALARDGLVEDPQDVDLLCALATALIDGGHERDGLVVADQAVALAPEWSDAHVLRGLALDRVGRSDEGLAAHRRALELDPFHDGAHRMLAGSLIRQTTKPTQRLRPGRRQALLDEARIHVDAALDLAPQLPASHLLRARLALASGNVPAARHDVGEALRIDPNDPAAHQLRGIVAEMSGEVAVAADAYVDAARLNPRSDLSLRRLRGLRSALPVSGVALYVVARIAIASGRAVGGALAIAVLALVVVGGGAFLVWPRWAARRQLSPEARSVLAADARLRGPWRKAGRLALGAVGIGVTLAIVARSLDQGDEPARPRVPALSRLSVCSGLTGQPVDDDRIPVTTCLLGDGQLAFATFVACEDGSELIVFDDVPMHGARGGRWEPGPAACAPLGATSPTS
jgi:Flp pilus assembly protein TadD